MSYTLFSWFVTFLLDHLLSTTDEDLTGYIYCCSGILAESQIDTDATINLLHELRDRSPLLGNACLHIALMGIQTCITNVKTGG